MMKLVFLKAKDSRIYVFIFILYLIKVSHPESQNNCDR